MTAAVKRDKLITYLADADEKKVMALYTLLEEDIKDVDATSAFTEEQLEILEERRASLLSGKDKGTDWQTTHDNIRKKRKRA
jgi:hypothetical protein